MTIAGRPASPSTVRLVQLALTLLVTVYMLLVGGTFDATLRFRVQLLNALASGTLALVWLALRLRQRERVRAAGLEWAVLLFALSQWIAALASAQIRLSLEAAASVTAWAIAFVIASDVLRAGWPRAFVVDALTLAAAVITAQAVWEVLAWYGLWAGLGQWPPVSFRLTGLLGHANATSAALNLLLPLVIVRAWRASGRAARLALWALASGMLISQFFSSSRGGWIAGAAGLTLMAGLLSKDAGRLAGAWRARWRGWPRAARLASAVLLLAAFGLTLAVLYRQAQHATHGSFLHSRQNFWAPAWSLFVARPLIGSGPELYAWFWPRAASVPPNEVAPHAHSLVFQLIGGSGLLGLGAALGVLAAGALRVRRIDLRAADGALSIALLSGLASALVHHLFDYFLNTPAFSFLLLAAAALLLTSGPALEAARRGFHPAWLALPGLAAAAVTAYALRGAALNEQGLALAAQNRWAEAGQAFELAARADPGLSLYWAEAAQAYTRAGAVDAALPLWQRAAADDPYWAVWPATVSVLSGDPGAMQAALDLAPGSALFALNQGVLYEAAGREQEAEAAYQRALDLDPAALPEALFWKQTSVRQMVLAGWRASQPVDESLLAQGWAALGAGRPEEAAALFERARAADPLSNLPYLGLTRAYWALGDEARAAAFLAAGQNLPVPWIWQRIDFQMLAGDWAAAHGDRAGAIAAYSALFSAYNEYTSFGPGTYGYPRRSWYVFYRAALPSDLVPQFVRADITPALDQRFAQLARWHLDDGEADLACLIAERVRREAPDSESGRLAQVHCP